MLHRTSPSHYATSHHHEGTVLHHYDHIMMYHITILALFSWTTRDSTLTMPAKQQLRGASSSCNVIMHAHSHVQLASRSLTINQRYGHVPHHRCICISIIAPFLFVPPIWLRCISISRGESSCLFFGFLCFELFLKRYKLI